MSVLTNSEVRSRAKQYVLNENVRVPHGGRVLDSASVLRKSLETYSTAKRYDVFLSHSIKDSDLVLGVKGILEDLGHSVYVDWIEDPQLDRTKVSAKTAEKLRQRMSTCLSLLYLTTQNAEESKWMPWECGYYDGFKGKVAILPVKENSTNVFLGQEYLGLYPYCVKQRDDGGNDRLWIQKDSSTYVSFKTWVKVENHLLEWKSNS